MKNLFWILTTAMTLNLAACGQGSHSLTASNPGKAKNGDVAGQEKVDGAFIQPENARSNKMAVGQSTASPLRVQKQTVQTDYQCVNDLLSERTLKANEAVKLLQGSQMVVAQDTNVVPNGGTLRGKSSPKPNPILNVLCLRATGDSVVGVLSNVEVDETIQKVRLDTGAAQQFVIKMGTVAKPVMKSVQVGCVVKEKIVEAAKTLSEFNAEGVDLLLVEGSAIQFMTTASDSGTAQRLIVGCGAAAAKAPTTPTAPPPPPVPEAPEL